MNIHPLKAAECGGADRRIANFFRRVCFGLAVFEIAVVLYGIARTLTRGAHFSYQDMAVPVCLAALFLFLGSRRARLGIEVAITAVLLLSGLTAIDLLIDHPGRRVQDSSFTREQKARELGIPYDFRGIPKVVTTLRDDGVDAYPHIAPSFLIGRDHDPVYPLGGISGKAVVFCNESGKLSIYPSDQHGFNNPPGSWNEGTLRSLVIGDSFANGACVQPGEDVASRLRDQGVSSVTLGMWGNGPLIELGSLVEYGPRLKPGAVFWLFYEEDLDRLPKEATDPLLPRYLEPGFSQNLVDRQVEIDDYLIDMVRAMYRDKGIDLKRPSAEAPVRYQLAGIALDWDRAGAFLDDCLRIACLTHIHGFVGNLAVNKYSGASRELFGRILARAKSVAGGWGGTIYLVYLPDYYRFASISPLARLNFQRLHEVATQAAQENGIEVIDLLDVFNAQADPQGLFPLRMYGHYTAETYALIARALAERLGHEDGVARPAP